MTFHNVPCRIPASELLPESLKAEAETLQNLRDAFADAGTFLAQQSAGKSEAEKQDSQALRDAKDPAKHQPANVNAWLAGNMKAKEAAAEAQAKLAVAEKQFAASMDSTAVERAEMADAAVADKASVHQANVEAFIQSREDYLSAIREADRLYQVADQVVYSSDEQRAARGIRSDTPYTNGDGGLWKTRRHVPPITEISTLAMSDLTFRRMADDDERLAYLLRNDASRHEDAPPAVRNEDTDGLAEYLRLGAGAVEVSKGARKGGRVTTL